MGEVMRDKCEAIIKSFEDKEWLAHLKNLSLSEILVIVLFAGLSMFFLRYLQIAKDLVLAIGPLTIFVIIIIQIYGYLYYLGKAHIEKIENKFTEVKDHEWPEMEQYFATQLIIADFTQLESIKKLSLKLNILAAYSTLAFIWKYNESLAWIGFGFSLVCTVIYLLLNVYSTRKHCIERAIDCSLRCKKSRKSDK